MAASALKALSAARMESEEGGEPGEMEINGELHAVADVDWQQAGELLEDGAEGRGKRGQPEVDDEVAHQGQGEQRRRALEGRLRTGEPPVGASHCAIASPEAPRPRIRTGWSFKCNMVVSACAGFVP